MYIESLTDFKKATSILLLVSFLTFIIGPIPTARAASLVNMSDTMSSLKAAAPSNHTIVFRTPTGVDATGETITITFPAGFSLTGLDFNDLDLAHTSTAQANCTNPTFNVEETLAATPAAGAWGVGVSGQIITLTPETTGPSIVPNACVQIQIGTNATAGATGDTQIVNPGAGSPAITIGGVFGDTGVITVTILTDDQVAVTAAVAQSVTFSISANSIQFGTLSASGPRYATTSGGDTNQVEAHNLEAGTNASSGYTITVAGPTLTAGNGTDTITAIGGTALAPATGSEQFGMRLQITSGSGVISAPYNTANFAYDGHTAADEVASAPGASATTTYSVRYVANITAQTEAGNYSTALTYVATANF